MKHYVRKTALQDPYRPDNFYQFKIESTEVKTFEYDVVENKNELFIVNSNGIKVEVYGTKFNVRNYTEDFNSDIVLVEGSVGINNSEILEQTILKPGFKGSVNKENFRVTTTKVNTKIYTSWIDGEVIFRNETFGQILKKLERLYNVTIINNKNESSNELFNAAIDVENEDIDKVLEYFNKIYVLITYLNAIFT